MQQEMKLSARAKILERGQGGAVRLRSTKSSPTHLSLCDNPIALRQCRRAHLLHILRTLARHSAVLYTPFLRALVSLHVRCMAASRSVIVWHRLPPPKYIPGHPLTRGQRLAMGGIRIHACDRSHIYLRGWDEVDKVAHVSAGSGDLRLKRRHTTSAHLKPGRHLRSK